MPYVPEKAPCEDAVVREGHTFEILAKMQESVVTSG
jgi:hypothetical protein